MTEHRIYLVPGMFGFGRLAGYDYFRHVRLALEQRFAAAGVGCATEVVPAPPTSSLRHRARILARTVERTAGPDEILHLVGHSTGGLDLRLVLAPTCDLDVDRERLRWTARVATAVSLNAPHYGTPLATYFSTVSGTRVLYALSLFTVVSLSLGEPSLALLARLISGVGRIDRLLGGDLRLVSRFTDGLLRFVDKEGRGDIQDFLGKIRIDQGGVIQLMPEAMDLFNASTADADRVRYGCVATASPPPSKIRLAARVRSPYAALTAAMYSTLYRFTAQRHEMYPYARPTGQQAEMLATGIGDVSDRSNDGVVPTRSMLWGKLLWCGEGDHLDVLGHFWDDARPREHTDWITSDARFSRRRFRELMDAIAEFQLGT